MVFFTIVLNHAQAKDARISVEKGLPTSDHLGTQNDGRQFENRKAASSDSEVRQKLETDAYRTATASEYLAQNTVTQDPDDTLEQASDSNPTTDKPAEGKVEKADSAEPVASKDIKIKSKKLTCATCEALDTRLSGRLTSEIYLTQRNRARILNNGVYALDTLTVLPFYETVQLRAEELYHKGLSVHFQGWTGVDLNDVYFDNRFERVVGDPTYLNVQFRYQGLHATAGRQMVYSGTARGLHLDGIDVSYQFPIYLGIEGFGGLVVPPYLGPNWYREQPDVDFDSFGPGFSDWERDGEYAFGGRLFYRRFGLLSGGLSILQVTELDETATQLIGADLALTPLSWFAVYCDAAMDLPTASFQQIDTSVDFYPIDMLSISIEHRYTVPLLFLPHTSIFTVFSQEEHHSLGGTTRIEPLDWLEAYIGYRHLLFDYEDGESEDGFEFFSGVTLQYLDRSEGNIQLHYSRLTDIENGLHEFRTRVAVPFAIIGLLSVTNLYLDIYDNRIKGEKLGFLADTGLFYRSRAIVTGGTVSAGTTPYDEEEIRVMLKFAYQFEKSFVERKQP